MLRRLLNKFSHDLGIDLGTSNTLIFVQDKGIVINEPSVVAINSRTDKILAVGREAKEMIGKTPPHIIVSRPLIKGVISDFEATEKMLKYFIEKVRQTHSSLLNRPRVIVGVPLGITEVERKAVEDAAMRAGARQVFLVEESMASAIGARLPIEESVGSMVVDMGGGTTEIAVISLSGIVTWKAIPIAGDELNKNVVQYAREAHNLLVGERIAENIKMRIGSAIELEEPLEMEMRGRDLVNGLPREVIVNDSQIREALHRGARNITESIKATLEITPPDLVADIYERGMVLTGGGAQLKGIDKLIAHATEVPVRVADDPLTCLVRGAAMLLENQDLLNETALPSAQDEQKA